MHVTNRVPLLPEEEIHMLRKQSDTHTHTHTCHFTSFSATFVTADENPHQTKRKNGANRLFISRN